MIIKINDEIDGLISIVQVNLLEYQKGYTTFKIFDMTGDTAIITPKGYNDIDEIIDDLLKNKFVEISGEINWE